MRFSGAVLAGGRSRRFGRDKARFVWRKKPLLGHALASLAEAEDRFVVANRPYPEAGVPVLPDLVPGRGALSGLHAALAYARHEVVAVAACDLPNLSPAYWRFLLRALGEAPALAVRGPEGRPEPLAALYTRRLLPLVEAWVRRGAARLSDLLAAAGARYLPWAEVVARFGPQVLWNVNRPEDLKGVGPR